MLVWVFMVLSPYVLFRGGGRIVRAVFDEIHNRGGAIGSLRLIYLAEGAVCDAPPWKSPYERIAGAFSLFPRSNTFPWPPDNPLHIGQGDAFSVDLGRRRGAGLNGRREMVSGRRL